jgi:hypothetical protein
MDLYNAVTITSSYGLSARAMEGAASTELRSTVRMRPEIQLQSIPRLSYWMTMVEWRAQGDDFRTFLSELVSALPQTGTAIYATPVRL